MKKYNLKRFLASLLAVLMLASVTGVSPAVFAEDVGSTPSQEETVKPVLKEQDVEVIIKSSMTNEAVAELLNKALISNYDELDDATKASLQWEYYARAYGKTTGAGGKNIWGAIKYSLQGTTQGRYLTGGVPPVRFSM